MPRCASRRRRAGGDLPAAPLCSFISSPLSLIDYLSNARLKLIPHVSLVRGEQGAAGIGTHLIKCGFPCLARAVGLISEP